MRHKISFLDAATFGPSLSFSFDRPKISHDWIQYQQTEADTLPARIADSTILIVNKVKLGRESLRNAQNIQFISLAATGSNNIDLDYCNEKGILVSNIRDYAFDTLPEHTFALILALRKNLLGLRKAIQNGEWEADGNFCLFSNPVDCLSANRMGIIGSGALGSRVAKIARAFGMEVFFSERKLGGKPPREGVCQDASEGDSSAVVRAEVLPFSEIISTSQVISLHCPLNDETRNLITKKELQQMRKDCLLINTARGGIIHEADLVEALQQGRIAGAGIDVVSSEPPGASHPYYKISHLPNFILTPHTAWSGRSALKRAWQQVIENIEGYCKKQPLRLL